MNANIKRNLIYISGITTACFLLLFIIYKFWDFDFNAPIIYRDDAYLTLYSFKAIKEGFLIYSNSYIGAPLGNSLYDFNISYDILNYVFIWLLTLVLPASTAMNVFYFLLFPITAVVCFFVLKRFGINNFISALISVLFTMLPYRFMRNEMHLFLSAYTFIPVIIMFAIWLYKDDNFFKIKRGFFKYKKNIFALCILPLIAFTGIYYTFYMALIFSFLTAVKFFNNKLSFKVLLPYLYIILYIAIFLIIASIPSFIYILQNGANISSLERIPQDSDKFSLNMLRLFISYNFSCYLNAEFLYSGASDEISEYLGLGGIIGFVILICVLFRRGNTKRAEFNNITILSLINLFLILYSCKNGLGTLFSILVTPLIRANSRISIFIAFISLYTLAALLQYFYNNFKIKHIKKTIAVLVIICLITQIPFDVSQNSRGEYYSDKAFIEKIETELNGGDMVYQLPYREFPEDGYTLLKGYLHSTGLRWSFGAYKGRDSANLQKYLSRLGTDKLLESLSVLGYAGVYLDSNLIEKEYSSDYDFVFEDYLSALEYKLYQTSISNSENTLYFISMKNYNEQIRLMYTAQEIETMRLEILKRFE